MAHKVYIHDGGGAGDIPANQLRCYKGWGHVESFKKKFPRSEIMAVITSCSIEGARYIKYNPYIDEIKELPWVNPHRPWGGLKEHIVGYTHITEAVKKLLPGQSAVIPPTYLSPDDKTIVQKVTSAGKYVFIHPFAGTKERMVLPIEEHPKLIDMLIDEFGYNVVVVGGTYTQLANQGRPNVICKEELEYERKGLFNLVNKSNMRIGIHLARHAALWLGTWSCYVWPGFIEGQRMALFMPSEYYNGAGVCDKTQQKIIRISCRKKIDDFSPFIKQAIEHLKG
jgi:hypothetical protein